MNNENWNDHLLGFLFNSTSVCYLIADQKGRILKKNIGMDMVLGNETRHLLNHLVNPDFDHVKELSQKEGFVFNGILTLKTHHHQSISLRTNIYYQKEEYLIIGEYNAQEYEKINQQISLLNIELNKTQRELMHKKIHLEKTIQRLHETQGQLVKSETMASLGKMVAGFAHELNTPIGIAVTASSSLDELQKGIKQLLKMEEVEEEILVDKLNSIHETSTILLSNLKLAADLVTSFKRTAIDQTQEVQSNFNIGELVSHVLLNLRNQFKKTSIQIETKYEKNLEIFSYPGILTQILINLLNNSFIHGFDNGKMKGTIKIELKKTDQELLINFSDNGKGIAPENLPHIFEPFFSKTRHNKSSGLGLFICYNLVSNQLHGQMNCYSDSGGTVFKIQFPLERISV